MKLTDEDWATFKEAGLTPNSNIFAIVAAFRRLLDRNKELQARLESVDSNDTLGEDQ